MTSGWPWALNELSDRIWLRISQLWTLVTISRISSSKILFVAHCSKSSNPQLSMVLEPKGPPGGLFASWYLVARAGLMETFWKGIAFSLSGFQVTSSGGRLTFWLAKSTRSHPMMNDKNTRSLRDLGPAAAASHLTMEKEGQNLKLGREPGGIWGCERPRNSKQAIQEDSHFLKGVSPVCSDTFNLCHGVQAWTVCKQLSIIKYLLYTSTMFYFANTYIALRICQTVLGTI